MVSESPKIERVRLKDLPAMAARFIDGAQPGTFIPISKHRAEALVHNPNADPEDVAMLLATEGDRCVGFFGVMAVVLQHEGKLHKVHWLTTWAVAPDFIGKGLGSRLMEEALALDVDLAIVGSKPARRISAKYGFTEVKPLDYVQIDFGVAGRYNPVSGSLRLLRKLLSLLAIDFKLESTAKAFEAFFEVVYGWLTRPIFYTLAAKQASRVEDVGPLSKVGEVPLTEKTGFYRSSETINWMLAHPWVSPTRSEPKMDYRFSDFRHDFLIFAIRTGDEAFICFQQSQVRGSCVLKVLDYNVKDPKVLFGAALLAARDFEAVLIEGPRELASPLGNGLLARLLVRRKQRTLQVHPWSADGPLGRAWQKLEQSYVDGDTAFT